MLGLYILAAMLGGGLLLFSMLSGAHHDVSDANIGGLDTDVSGLHVGASGIHVDVAGAHVDTPAMHVDHDIDVSHVGAGELVLGLFKPRNIIFFLTAFGLTGALLTATGNSESATFAFALGMGGGAMLLTHSLFIWLRRSESAMDVVDEREMEGRAAKVVLPLAPGERGRVVCLIGDREVYITARLAADVMRPLDAGREVVVLRVVEGVAEVIPFDVTELPPAES